jgi:hypothetical protein
MKKYSLFFLWWLLVENRALAQKTMVIDSMYEAPSKRESMIGLNVSPLLLQLMPFNTHNPLISGLYNVSYKSYKNQKAFVVSVGATTFSANNTQQNPFLNIRIGLERQKVAYKNWFYTKGVSLVLSNGHLNIFGNSGNSRRETATIGIGPTWSFGYSVNQTISIGSEMMLLVGSGDDGFDLAFLPPLAIEVLIHVSKKTKN